MSKPYDMPTDLINLSSHDKLFNPEKFNNVITRNVIRIFGCSHCEWQGSDHCPYLNDSSWFTGNDLTSKICDKRKNHLLSLSPPLHNNMTWSEWQRGFNINYSEKIRNEVRVKLDSSYLELVKLQDLLNTLEVGTPEYNQQLRLLDFLHKQIRSYESRIDALTKFIVHYQDQQLGRESTKKISVEKHLPNPMDIGKVIKDAKELN